MSSRALRKLQREQEEARLTKLQDEEDKAGGAEDDEGEEEEEEAIFTAPKRNAFDFLNEAEEENEGSDEDLQESQSQKLPSTNPALGQGDADESDPESKDASKNAGKRKAKKKGKKKRKSAKETPATNDQRTGGNAGEQGLDDIDLALRSLKVQSTKEVQHNENTATVADLNRFYALLAVDTRNLNALNEMKKLFGNVVLAGENEAAGQAQGRRRGRGQQPLDLGRALAGQNSPVSRGQGLAGLALRRNVFMLGKEEWPKATSGGLGMELVEKLWDNTTEYRFTHSTAYQDVQRHFQTCVELMDPQRMVVLLQSNPYHISTLLQVSEIAKQQGDHSVSGDLLERALFAFGRTVHSSFPAALAEGKPRMDFRRPENREFWLAAWRYIVNLGQRGTWRTAFEWAKLVLSLDPESDPYCMHLLIDQLALRGGQFEQLIKLVEVDKDVIDWGQLSPNVRISYALALHKAKQPEKCREVLRQSVISYPWIFVRMFQELSIDHVPKSIWGKEPPTEYHKLLCELYVTRAKDVWNTPDAISFLVEVVETTDIVVGDPPVDHEKGRTIGIDEARHVMLSEIPVLIALLPRSFTAAANRMSAADPFPPEDNIFSYGFVPDDSPPDSPPTRAADAQGGNETNEQELRGLQGWFSGLLGRIRGNLNATEAGGQVVLADEEEMRNPELLRERLQRLEELETNRFNGRREEPPDEEDAMIARAIQESQAMFESSQAQAQAEIQREREADAAAILHPRNTEPRTGVPPAPQVEDDTESEPEPEGYNDERNQRWLAGQGLQALKTFLAEHGADETKWMNDPTVNSLPALEYVQRLNLLQKRATKNFIIDYLLQQGAGGEARDMVRRLVL
jgi:hypothetical protein